MILILGIEVVIVCFTAWALSVTYRRWRVAERRRTAYQAAKGNGLRGFANRLRCDREAARVELQIVYLVFGSSITLWRAFNLERPTVFVASMLLHVPLIYGTTWAYRQTLADLKTEAELFDMQEHDDQVRETERVDSSQITSNQHNLQAGIDDANVKLDAAEHQRASAAATLVDASSAVITRIDVIDVSAQDLQAKVAETAKIVAVDTAAALDSQTDKIAGHIEEAKHYTAGKADAAYQEANHVNVRFQRMQDVIEKQGEILQRLLEIVEAQLPGNKA